MRPFFALAMVLAVSSCSDSSASNTPDSGGALPDAHASADAAPGTSPDAHPVSIDAGPVFDAAPVPDAGPTFNLTITNQIRWCSVTANGELVANASTPESVTKAFPQNQVVNLHADPLPSFVWGFWIGTDHNSDQTTTVTLDGPKTVTVCCPVQGTATCP